MKASDDNPTAKSNHRTVKASTTLSRKYTKRPKMGDEVEVSVKKSAKVTHFDETDEVKEQIQAQIEVQQEQMREEEPKSEKIEVKTEVEEPKEEAEVKKEEPVAEVKAQPVMQEIMASAEVHPMQQMANKKMQARKTQPKVHKASAKELKDQAIKKALASANHMAEQEKAQNKAKNTSKLHHKMHFGFGRIMLALGCATAAVVAIVYFVNLNMPDISLRVAAMQTGMDPSYPSYTPRSYSLSSVTSEENRITMDFVSPSEKRNYSLVEEKSSWDSNALLTNYVKPEWNENYTIVREQGLTIYISGSNAAWVNGGKLFKIKAAKGTLTNKQIKAIAVSL